METYRTKKVIYRRAARTSRSEIPVNTEELIDHLNAHLVQRHLFLVGI